MEYKAFFFEKFHSAKRFSFPLEVIDVKGVACAMNQEHRSAAVGHVWVDGTKFPQNIGQQRRDIVIRRTHHDLALHLRCRVALNRRPAKTWGSGGDIRQY